MVISPKIFRTAVSIVPTSGFVVLQEESLKGEGSHKCWMP